VSTATPQMVGRWKTIPVVMCTKHPDRRARARAMCASCYVKWFYAGDEAYRIKSNARVREWVKNNPERAQAIQIKKRAKQTPDSKKRALLKSKYGITLEQFNQMLLDQGGVCALCNQAPASGKCLHVDHCHQTGRVRGLLCHQCNWYLGKVDADPTLLARLQKYSEAANVQP
jgi:Recombination endonuclease VII